MIVWLVPMCQTRNYKNTNTKYTNTVYDEVPERPNMWHIFEMQIVQGYQKWYSYESNMQLQKYKYKIHKYTNTAYDEAPERPNMWHIFEMRIVQGYQKWYCHVSNAQIQKCEFGIHKYIICRNARKIQHVVYFWKEDCSGISSESRTVVQGLL